MMTAVGSRGASCGDGANRPARVPAGAAQGVALCTGARPRRAARLPPQSNRVGAVFQPRTVAASQSFTSLRARGVAAGQRTADHDALDRFGHVQPGAAQRGVERHHPMGAQPANQLRRLVAGEIVPDEQARKGGNSAGSVKG
jgi:hypothetical protein